MTAGSAAWAAEPSSTTKEYEMKKYEVSCTIYEIDDEGNPVLLGEDHDLSFELTTDTAPTVVLMRKLRGPDTSGFCT